MPTPPTKRRFKAGDYVVLRKKYQTSNADARPVAIGAMLGKNDMYLCESRAKRHLWASYQVRPATRKEILAMGVEA